MRIEDDMRDGLDEELEMELEGSRLDELQGLRDGHEKSETLGCDLYFKELYACL